MGRASAMPRPSAMQRGDDLKASNSLRDSVSDNEITWYLSRDEIKANSPSRKDGIDSVHESVLRKSYCAFLKELGIRLRMPNYVIATSSVFCHRFYLHQSHKKNDRFIIATACMFLAGKVEEARRALEDVALLSYYLRNKNTPLVHQEIKDRNLCEKQKELVLLAEQVVLVTLNFNLKVWNPYECISNASKHKQVPHMLISVASILLNDSLFTTLFLQFESQHIAASALLLAAKLIKYKIPHQNWWAAFSVTLAQLEEICVQILEFYEEERLPLPMVQSSSSSSSVDRRQKGLGDSFAVTPQDEASRKRPCQIEGIVLQHPESKAMDSKRLTKRR